MKDNYDAIASYFYQHYGNVMNKSDLKEFSVFGIFSVVQLEHWNYRCRPNPKLFGIIASQMHKLNLGQSIQNFVHPKLFMASQITYGIPNYLWHPKLFMASQII
jgi:hypothetical protein